MASTVSRKSVRKSTGCFVESTLAAIGGRWKVLVIFHLLKGTQRFGELTRLLGGISARTLTRQLRELEDAGVIDRVVYHEIPPKVEYSLTSLGRQLEPVLQAMHEWGAQLEKSQQLQGSPQSKR